MDSIQSGSLCSHTCRKNHSKREAAVFVVFPLCPLIQVNSRSCLSHWNIDLAPYFALIPEPFSLLPKSTSAHCYKRYGTRGSGTLLQATTTCFIMKIR